MARSTAATVPEYLDSLPPDRKDVVARVRNAVLASLPEGYQECMRWGMISYEIPLERYPGTYNGQPLAFAALAAQKSYYALYLTCVYADSAREASLKESFERAGKKLDMGKSCIRFKRLEDLPLPAIEDLIASIPPERFIAEYETTRIR